MQGQRVLRLAVVAVTALTIAVAVAGPATAGSATSGKIYRGTVPYSKKICAEAVIRDTADNLSWTTVWTSSLCTNSTTVPSGYLGTMALGYKDGSYCDNTGWIYNSVTSSLIGVSSGLCSNPAGTQEFYTKADSRAWDTGIGGYRDYLRVTSPSQNY